MAEKNETKVLIRGNVLTLSGYEPVDYQQKVASYINDKYDQCEHMDGFRFLNSDTKSVLLDLNIADDYFKAKAHLEVLEIELEKKNSEADTLKNQLAILKSKLETAQSQVAELQEMAGQNAAKIMKLETELKRKNQ